MRIQLDQHSQDDGYDVLVLVGAVPTGKRKRCYDCMTLSARSVSRNYSTAVAELLTSRTRVPV